MTFGRQQLIEAIARSRAALTVLEGDSGVGKSTVLTDAQEASASRGAVAPAPRTVPYSGGPLQRALLEGLADAVAVVAAREGNLERISRHLVDAAKRLAADRGQELARVIGKELLSIVRSRLGPEAGDALAGYVRELKTSVDESLAARISAAIDRGVAGLVLDFGAEVCALNSVSDVNLAIDAAERLRQDDLHLLADLASDLPEALRLKLAVSTYTEKHRQKVQFLDGAGASVIRIEGLSEDEVRSWLSAERLDPANAGAAVRATSGYGLHVSDLVRHLKQGGEIKDAPLNQQFAARTREAWNALDADFARHARSLCVFADPLSEERTEAYVGLDVHQRADLEDRLLASSIFSDLVNGRPWFHEQRRQFILHDVLDERERDQARGRAAEELATHLEESEQRLAELASLVMQSPSLVERRDRLSEVVSMSRAELAVASAVLELVDRKAEYPAVIGDQLLRHAHNVFAVDGDLLAALRELGRKGIVEIVEQEGAAAIVPYSQDELVPLTVAGRAVQEFGRAPLPSVATAVFELEVEPQLGHFEKAHYGIGRASVARLAELALDLGSERGGLIVVSSDPGNNLLIRARYADRPVYAAITFDGAEGRDAAMHALLGLKATVFDEEFAIVDAFPHPAELVPSLRFIKAAQRVVSGHLPAAMPHLKLEEPVSFAEALEREAAALEVIRERSSPIEEAAAQIDEAVATLWHSDQDSRIEIEIRGGRDGPQPLDQRPPFDPRDAFHRYRLAQAVKLRPGEEFGTITTGGGAEPTAADPVVALLAELQMRAANYNKLQGYRQEVILNAESLEVALTDAARLALEDAEALAEAVQIGDGPPAIQPRETYLIVYLDPDEPRMSIGASSTVRQCRRASMDGNEHVRATIVEGLRAGPGVHFPGFGELFGIPEADDPKPGSGIGVGWGRLHAVLGPMLGYAYNEVAFRRDD